MSSNGIEIKAQNVETVSAIRTLNHITTIIQESAKRMLGQENIFNQSWVQLREREYAYLAFSTLIDAKRPLTLSEIKDLCGAQDEEYKVLMKDLYDERIEDGINYLTRGNWEYPLIDKSNGSYRVTDIGVWMWRLCSSGMPASMRFGDARAQATRPGIEDYGSTVGRDHLKSKLQNIIKIMRDKV